MLLAMVAIIYSEVSKEIARVGEEAQVYSKIIADNAVSAIRFDDPAAAAQLPRFAAQHRAGAPGGLAACRWQRVRDLSAQPVR